MIRLALAVWKFVGGLFGGENGVRRTRIFALGQLLVICALVGVGLWQRHRISQLERWRDDVLIALAQAVDQRDSAGHVLSVKIRDVTSHIRDLGRFRSDTLIAQDKAALADAGHAAVVRRKDETTNRKASDDFDTRIAAARSSAALLRSRPARTASGAGLMRAADRPAANGKSGGGKADLPGLSPARSQAAAPSGTNELPEPAPAPMTVDERLLASEQAIQLDQLITAVLDLAKNHEEDTQ